MKKVIIYSLVAVLTVLCAVSFFPRALVPVAYAGDASSVPNSTQAESNAVESNQQKLVNAVPLPQLDNSLERLNISKRLTMWNDPNKISYIYLVSYGRVMAFYTVKGKVTSGNKRLTENQVMIGYCNNLTGSNCVPKDAPELDGTYGSSNPYIFFWTTSGAYIQWSGDYMLADQPLQLATAPELTLTVK